MEPSSPPPMMTGDWWLTKENFDEFHELVAAASLLIGAALAIVSIYQVGLVLLALI